MTKKDEEIDERVANLVALLSKFPNVKLFTSFGYHEPKNECDSDFEVNLYFDPVSEAGLPLTLITFAVQEASIESIVLISDKAWAHVKVWVNSDEPVPETLTFAIQGRHVEPDRIADYLEQLLSKR